MKLYLIGLLGSGKSFLGRQLAQLMKLPFIDLDDAIESAEGIKIPEIFSEKGEDYFRKVEAETLRNQSSAREFVMATGGGVPCFHNNMKFINENGVSIFLNTPVQIIVSRIDLEQKKSRPLLAAIDDHDLEKKLNEMLQKRLPFYEQAQITVQGETITPREIVQLVSKK